MAELTISIIEAETQAHGEEISAEHFGVSVNARANDIGDLGHERLDDIVEAVGAGTLRFPGGTLTEEFFDITDPNNPDNSHNNGTPNDKSDDFVDPIGLKFTQTEFFEYCGSVGKAAAMVVPMTDGVNALLTPGNSPADFEAWLDDVRTYIRNTLDEADDHNVTIKSFELGNEYESIIDPSSPVDVHGNQDQINGKQYAEVAAQAALIIQEELDAHYAADAEQPAIAIQIFNQRPDGKDASTLPAQNDGVIEWIADNLPEAFDVIDAVAVHYYLGKGSGAADFDIADISEYEDVEAQTEATEAMVQSWYAATGKSVDVLVTEWNVSHHHAEYHGLKQTAVMLEIFSELVEAGADAMQHWSTQNHPTSLSAGPGNPASPDALTIAGQFFNVMRENLVGKHETEVTIDSTDAVMHAYSDGTEAVIFISSQSTGSLEYTYDLGALSAVESMQILGATGTDGVFKSETGLAVYEEPDALLDITTIAAANHGSQVSLGAYETLMITIDLTDPGAPTFLGSVLEGTSGNDNLEGGSTDDFINGNGGRDGLWGRDGDDIIFGGDGIDNIGAGGDDDYINAGGGNDTVGGGSGNDTIHLGDGNDTAGGGPGNDIIYAGAGNDIANGGGGHDHIYLGDGDDESGAGGHNDHVWGGAGNDDLGGGAGSDHLFGGSGDDSLGGGSEDDFLFGGLGNDHLSGGAGNDTYTGGAGADKFSVGFADTNNEDLEFAAETETITDFELGVDVIQLKWGGTASDTTKFQQLILTDVGGDLTITHANWSFEIVLQDFTGTLSEDDFIF